MKERMVIPEYQIFNENNLETLKRMADNSLDAVVTDAPYGLGKEPDAAELIKAWLDTGYLEIKGKGFMGKEWDAFVPQPAFWKEVYRVLKPGGYVLCFFGTRTYDWGTLAIRLAGFEIRDCIQWIYGSGFPKSLDVGKAIDKRNGRFFDSGFKDYCNERRTAKGLSLAQVNHLLGVATNGGGIASSYMGDKNDNELPTLEMYRKLKAILDLDDRFGDLIEMVEAEREVIDQVNGTLLAVAPGQRNDRSRTVIDVTAPATEPAKQWDGYGTALKPAHEPICVARKPLEGTVAQNTLKHNCGAINIDGCRIPNDEILTGGTGVLFSHQRDNTDPKTSQEITNNGRFPANIIIDEEAAEIIDAQSGILSSGKMKPNTTRHNRSGYAGAMSPTTGSETYGDSGGASRFFYCAKASTADRDYGLSGEATKGGFKNGSGRGINGSYNEVLRKNSHPTVKPISLMRYLVRLVKTPFDTCKVGDFFLGSGTTGIACMLEGVNFIGSERDEDSYQTAKERIAFAQSEYTKEQSKPKQANLFE